MIDRESYERELRKRQAEHLERLAQPRVGWRPCMHDTCTRCHGTGITRFGPCVHGFACPCPRCSPC